MPPSKLDNTLRRIEDTDERAALDALVHLNNLDAIKLSLEVRERTRYEMLLNNLDDDELTV